MINRAFWMAAALLALLAFGLTWAQDKQPLTDDVVIGVLKEAFPELDAASIKVKLLKRLTSRAKVNLEIEGRNAILYLSWQRGQGGSRWWFEIDENRSLVYLSKTTESARPTPTRTLRRGVEPPATEEKSSESDRTETIEVNVDARKPDEAKEEAAEEPEVEPAAEEPAAEEAAEKPAAVEPAEQKPVAEEAEEEPAPEPEVEPTEEEKPAVTEEEKPAPEVKPVEQETEPAEEPKPAEEPEPAQEVVEKPAEAEPEVKPEAEEAEEVEPEPEQAEPAEDELEPELTVEVDAESETSETVLPEIEAGATGTRELPLAEAVGPAASNQDFLTHLVAVMARGSAADYAKFLLRSDEIAERIAPERFQHLLGLWDEQCGAVHAELRDVARVEVKRITLQRARDEEVEQATIERLRLTVPSVTEIFTSVRIDLLLDGEPAYIDIGGLMRIATGWRVGGRMSFARGPEPPR